MKQLTESVDKRFAESQTNANETSDKQEDIAALQAEVATVQESNVAKFSEMQSEIVNLREELNNKLKSSEAAQSNEIAAAPEPATND